MSKLDRGDGGGGAPAGIGVGHILLSVSDNGIKGVGGRLLHLQALEFLVVGGHGFGRTSSVFSRTILCGSYGRCDGRARGTVLQHRVSGCWR